MRGPITMDPAGDKVNGERARRCGTSLCHRVRGPRSRRYWLFPPRRLSGAFRPFTGPVGNGSKGSIPAVQRSIRAGAKCQTPTMRTAAAAPNRRAPVPMARGERD
jgi:hypothetical protein